FAGRVRIRIAKLGGKANGRTGWNKINITDWDKYILALVIPCYHFKVELLAVLSGNDVGAFQQHFLLRFIGPKESKRKNGTTERWSTFHFQVVEPLQWSRICVLNRCAGQA